MPNRDKAFILYHHSNFALPEALQTLSERGLNVTPNDGYFQVQWHGGPILRVEHFHGQAVQQQIARLAKGTPHAAATKEFDSLFQITFDDLNEVLDEINTLIEVQATLQDATQGYQFNTWNRVWLEPEE